ncbi:MAG: hypothetical protein JWO31_1972 [Phycisphaerales bacterium]|nr:hypothetical protein [Phycisphaerales bacterium]
MTIVMLSPSAVADTDESAYASRRNAEQDVLDAHPDVADLTDAALIAAVANEDSPEGLVEAALVVLERRLSGVCPRRPN